MAESRDPDSEHSPYLSLPWPIVAASLIVVLAVALGIGIYANQNLRGTARTSSQPTLVTSAVDGLKEITPSRPTPSTTPTNLPILSTPSTPTSVALLVVTPTVLAIATTMPAVPAINATQVVAAAPELREEIDVVYQHYWQVRAEALYSLDTAKLQEVMAGQHLLSVEELISQLRTEGRGLRTSVSHNYVFVDESPNDVTLLDRYIDNSIYVDAQSGVPLSEPTGATLIEQYRLVKSDGSWKVVSLVRPT
jgi:hypothetical protein